eukprot:6491839-Amphidinium_carterae.1
MLAFSGTGRGAAMIAPDLMEHVAKELERSVGIKKHSRKLREEMSASGGKKGGGGQPGGAPGGKS